MIIIYLMAAFIFLFMFASRYQLWQEKKLCTKVIEGKVVKKEEYKDFQNHICYYVMVSYLYEGKEYKNYIIDKVRQKQIAGLEKQKEISFCVNPNNPDKIRLNQKVLSLQNLVTLIGSGLMLIGLSMLVLEWVKVYVFS